MSTHEAAQAMELAGFLAEPLSRIGPFGPLEQVRARFKAADAPVGDHAVTAYFVASIGLTCVAVDAVAGPQVIFDGIRLVGRAPADLSADMAAYLERTGRGIEITPYGDIASQELGTLPRAQRTGDLLLTRAIFGRPHEWANTMFDSIPADAMDGC